MTSPRLTQSQRRFASGIKRGSMVFYRSNETVTHRGEGQGAEVRVAGQAQDCEVA
jgi:hypothetical protein